MTQTFKDYIEARFAQSDLANVPFDKFDRSQMDLSEAACEVPQANEALNEALDALHKAVKANEALQELSQNGLGKAPEEFLKYAELIKTMPELHRVAELSADNQHVSPTESRGPIRSFFGPKTVFVQLVLAGVVSFGPGVGGTLFVGFGFCLDKLDLFSIYIGGSVGVATGELAAGGVGVGLTATEYAEMTGISAGIDFGAAYIEGGLVDFGISLRPALLPPFVTWSPGGWYFGIYDILGGGVAAEGYLALALTIYRTIPAAEMPVDAKYAFVINQIECFHKYDGNKHDELYLELNVDDFRFIYRYPFWDSFAIEQQNNDNTNDNAIWDLGWTIAFNQEFTLKLMDYNGPLWPATTLCTFSYDGAAFEQEATAAGDDFSLEYDNDPDGGSINNHVAYSCYCQRTR